MKFLNPGDGRESVAFLDMEHQISPKCSLKESFISTTKSYFECGGSILTERNSKNLNLIPRLILSSFPAAPSSEQLLETSLVVQGLRLCTPNAGAGVQSLVRELGAYML